MITQITAGCINDLLIALWCMIDSRTAPGITGPRPYGIAALLVIGALVAISDSTSLYMVGLLSFIASLFFLAAVIGVWAFAIGDHASHTAKTGFNYGVILLMVATAMVAYGLGSTAALVGTILAIASICGTYIYSTYAHR